MRKALWLALAVLFFALPLWGQALEIQFLDVGQGDAILIREGERPRWSTPASTRPSSIGFARSR